MLINLLLFSLKYNGTLLYFRLLGFYRVPPVVGRKVNMTKEIFMLAEKELKRTFFVSPSKLYEYINHNRQLNSFLGSMLINQFQPSVFTLLTVSHVENPLSLKSVTFKSVMYYARKSSPRENGYRHFGQNRGKTVFSHTLLSHSSTVKILKMIKSVISSASYTHLQ